MEDVSLEQRNPEFVQGKMACGCVTGACIIVQTPRVGMEAFLNTDCLTLQSEYPLSGAFYVIIKLCRSELSTRMHRPPPCGFTHRGALGTLTAVGLSLSHLVPADCNMPVVSTLFRLP